MKRGTTLLLILLLVALYPQYAKAQETACSSYDANSCPEPVCQVGTATKTNNFFGCESREDISVCENNPLATDELCYIKNKPGAVQSLTQVAEVPITYKYEEKDTTGWKVRVQPERADIIKPVLLRESSRQGDIEDAVQVPTEHASSEEYCKYYSFIFGRTFHRLVYDAKFSRESTSDNKKKCFYDLAPLMDEITSDLNAIGGKPISEICPDLVEGREFEPNQPCPEMQECVILTTDGPTAYYGLTFEKDACGNRVVKADNDGQSIPQEEIDKKAEEFLTLCKENSDKHFNIISCRDNEPNDFFDEASLCKVPRTGERAFEGGTGNLEDIDTYLIEGPFSRGDRIIIDVTGNDGLNTVAAIFDDNQDIIDANDDRSYYARALNPYIAQLIRQDTENIYLGIAVTRAAYFASEEGRFAGTYSIRAARKPDTGLEQPPQQQLVYLNFEAGPVVQIGLEPFVTMNGFSAESISQRHAGRTDQMIEMIIERMKADFADYNVILTDSRHSPPPDHPHTTLYFGNFNAAYLGLADNVDTGNIYPVQEAIIYTEDLALFESLSPTFEETALAIANIASHELGHLLGLEHTAEAGDLMATASTARQVIEIDADFRRARLLGGVFPIGWQNNPETLLLNVGGRV